jgi:hypothetical protein
VLQATTIPGVQSVEGARDLVRRFVVRARRIAAHSLVRDWGRLTGLAEDGFRVRGDISTGTTRIVSRLPPDEEVFESLVARLRPLILQGDALHYTKVFGALGHVLHDGRTWTPLSGNGLVMCANGGRG